MIDQARDVDSFRRSEAFWQYTLDTFHPNGLNERRFWLSCYLYIYILNGWEKFVYIATIPHKNIETNDKFYRKVAFLMYTEMVDFRPQS